MYQQQPLVQQYPPMQQYVQHYFLFYELFNKPIMGYQQFPQQIQQNQMNYQQMPLNSQRSQPLSYPMNPMNNYQNQIQSQPLQPQTQRIYPQQPISCNIYQQQQPQIIPQNPYQNQSNQQYHEQLPKLQNIQQLVPQTLYLAKKEIPNQGNNEYQPVAQNSLTPTIDSTQRQSSTEINKPQQESFNKRQDNQKKSTIKKPLTNLNGLKYPQKFFCENCQEEMTSKLTYEISSGTKLVLSIYYKITYLLQMACLLIMVCACWVPFCNKDCKDKTHNCPKCEKVVGQAQYKPC